MRGYILGLAVCCLLISPAWAINFGQKSDYNQHYVGDDEDEEKPEVKLPLPEYPKADTSWFNLYINETYQGTVGLLLNSVQFTTDKNVHYILNMRSVHGINNLSVETLSCKRRGVRYLAFGDDVNHRWIKSKRSEWRTIGNILTEFDAVRGVLFNVFCVDGLPRDNKELMERLQTRAVR